MTFRNIIFSLIYLVVFSHFEGMGQNSHTDHEVSIEIPELALLGISSEGSGQINIAASAPNEAGNRIELAKVQQNNEVWLNYSSIIRSHSHRRKVVAVLEGEIPPGLRLTVEASPPAGGGKGRLGYPVGRINLTTIPSEIISDIGSCFTGKGLHNGHLLSYRLEKEDSDDAFATLTKNQISLHVVYTLTDNN